MTVADAVMMYIVMLLILLNPQDSMAADTTDKHLPSRDLHVNVSVSPPAPQLMLVGNKMRISVVVRPVGNLTCDGQRPSCDALAALMSVSSHRPMTVVALTAHSPLQPENTKNTLANLHFRLNNSIVVVVHALSVGRAVLTFEISTASSNLLADSKKIAVNGIGIRYTAVHNEIESSESTASTRLTNADGAHQPVAGSSPSRLLAVIEYHITVARRRRLVDDGFFWAVAAGTLLNAFGLGCVTIYNDVKKELLKLRPSVLATLLCQYVILPPVGCANFLSGNAIVVIGKH